MVYNINIVCSDMVYFVLYFVIAVIVSLIAFGYYCWKYNKTETSLKFTYWMDEEDYTMRILGISFLWIVAVPAVALYGIYISIIKGIKKFFKIKD